MNREQKLARLRDWYAKHKNDPEVVARAEKRRASFKNLNGRYITVGRDKTETKQVRYDPLVNRGVGGYKHNGITKYL